MWEEEDELLSGSTNAEPGAIATGSKSRHNGACQFFQSGYVRLECRTRSLSLPVLYLSTSDGRS